MRITNFFININEMSNSIALDGLPFTDEILKHCNIIMNSPFFRSKYDNAKKMLNIDHSKLNHYYTTYKYDYYQKSHSSYVNNICIHFNITDKNIVNIIHLLVTAKLSADTTYWNLNVTELLISLSELLEDWSNDLFYLDDYHNLIYNNILDETHCFKKEDNQLLTHCDSFMNTSLSYCNVFNLPKCYLKHNNNTLNMVLYELMNNIHYNVVKIVESYKTYCFSFENRDVCHQMAQLSVKN